ncbi:nucleotidyltransferase family protein [Sphingomonas alba]|uniref:Nucleotidyltransferase family protein n=1 Tax=Sphingomonas alba TaxID=2908208 RepID=A0ABT0RJK5_9SPHN|nr:nucleotidyltransferase family protein [Sphingomonas alba]MCL6682818.1 nucleotidyltransferase family protein [Sphingomonas alba]
MRPDDADVRDFLAAALRGEQVVWPGSAEPGDVAEAAIYQGVAGLLIEREHELASWPPETIDRMRTEARGRAMWELRHRLLLAELLDSFAAGGIDCLVLKGTAVAYDLYANAATRMRGDTDLLVAAKDVASAKEVLCALGYMDQTLGGVSPEFALQQTWTLKSASGAAHSIDLHWQALNAPSLKGLLRFQDCLAHSIGLPRLSPHARTMDRARLLVHTCLHRATQHNAPYVVDGATYYDPGRLIWLWDIHLLGNALSSREWLQLSALANDMKVSGPCLEALTAAASSFGTPIPNETARALGESAVADRTNRYFTQSHAASRAIQDIWAIPGWLRKLKYVQSRIVTTEPFLRAKYPQLADRPLPLLYGRRLLDVVRRKSNAG